MQSGGQGIYLHALTRELARLGCHIDVYVGPPYPDPLPWAREFRIENQRFWGKRFDKRPGAFLDRAAPFSIFRPLDFYEFAVTRFGFLPEPFAFSLRAAAALVREAKRGARYDLVHDVQSVGYGLLGLQAMGLPVVTTIHHPLSIDLRSSLARDRTFAERKGSLTFYPVRSQARVARRLAAVLTSSQASRARDRAATSACAPERIHDVRNGVELPAPAARRARPARSELLFVGRCGDPNKGLEFLLQALALLAARGRAARARRLPRLHAAREDAARARPRRARALLGQGLGRRARARLPRGGDRRAALALRGLRPAGDRGARARARRWSRPAPARCPR